MEIDKLERLLGIRTVVLLTFLNSREGVQVYPTLSPILVSRVPTILCFTFDRSYIAVSLTRKEFVVNFMRKKYKREVERYEKESPELEKTRRWLRDDLGVRAEDAQSLVRKMRRLSFTYLPPPVRSSWNRPNRQDLCRSTRNYG